MKKILFIFVGLILVVFIFYFGNVLYDCRDFLLDNKLRLKDCLNTIEEIKKIQDISNVAIEKVDLTVSVSEVFKAGIGNKIKRDQINEYIYKKTGMQIKFPSALPNNLWWGDININKKINSIMIAIGERNKDEESNKFIDIDLKKLVGYLSIQDRKPENWDKLFFEQKISLEDLILKIGYSTIEKERWVIKFEKNGLFYQFLIWSTANIERDEVLKIIQSFI